MGKNAKFQSTHPLRGATIAASVRIFRSGISIHAPLAGCDQPTIYDSHAALEISIHAPLAGCDSFAIIGLIARLIFQSTHPLRGATLRCPIEGNGDAISIHAPLAGCDRLQFTIADLRIHFNPRTPCGVRPLQDRYQPKAYQFQSTHPLRGATKSINGVTIVWLISIHAPLAGCDYIRAKTGTGRPNFNPRTPCGVRPDKTVMCAVWENFNPRTPCGVRPHVTAPPVFLSTISIHAPLAGCDSSRWTSRCCH